MPVSSFGYVIFGLNIYRNPFTLNDTGLLTLTMTYIDHFNGLCLPKNGRPFLKGGEGGLPILMLDKKIELS
jgi:hypothetical protein